jgi:hypothetical protein
VPVSCPRLFTWFSALAYAVLLTGGGAGGRNWSPLVSRNGVIEPQLVKTGAGEVGRGGAIVTRLGACGRGGRGRRGAVGGAQSDEQLAPVF